MKRTISPSNTRPLRLLLPCVTIALGILCKSPVTQAEEKTAPEINKKTTGTAPKPLKPKASGKLYKWVDAEGNISYQDSPPPKSAKILNGDLLKESTPSNTPVRELKRSTKPAFKNDGSQPVMVYTADNCKSCQSVVLYLTKKQVPFIERDIRTDRAARQRLSEMSKQISVPSLFIGDRIIQGDSKQTIARALEEAGYFKKQQ